MVGDLDRVLRGLAAARKFAGAYRFEMTAEYRALIAQLEALPQNRAGRDKSAVWPALRDYVDSFRRAEPVRHP